MLTIDFVVETSLVAIYSNNLLSDKVFLKGGQALRIKERLVDRFSADLDFSTPGKIENVDLFFESLRESLIKEFYQNKFLVFDFKWVRRPAFRSKEIPDFWSGWAVEFKIIEEHKNNLSPEERSREALVPIGGSSPKITLDISEYEYCDSIENVKIKNVNVKSYSRTLLLLEKIRALCQQHPDYKLKGIDQRARDYYDIERLWQIVLQTGKTDAFLDDCAKHINNVFSAKGVDISLLEKIFEPDFIELQKSGWVAVQQTVSGKLSEFEYYNESLASLIKEIQNKMVICSNR